MDERPLFVPMDPRTALKEWRGDKSYREAGGILKCDPSFVRYVEIGERKPGLALAIRMRDAAGIPVDAWELIPTAKPKSEGSGEHTAVDPDASEPDASEPAA